jgi:hypothetical protein
MNLRSDFSLAVTALLCGLAVSCIGRDPPSITSSDPDRLVPAIKIGVRTKDPHIIPYLVKDLDSDDPAIRMYSIDGLQRLTGQDFGYVYFACADQRRAAVARWQEWLSLQPAEPNEQ